MMDAWWPLLGWWGDDRRDQPARFYPVVRDKSIHVSFNLEAVLEETKNKPKAHTYALHALSQNLFQGTRFPCMEY